MASFPNNLSLCNIKRLTIRRSHLSYAYGSSNDGPFRSQRSNNFNSLSVFNYNNYHYFYVLDICRNLEAQLYDRNSRQVTKEYLEHNINEYIFNAIYILNIICITRISSNFTQLNRA